MPLLPAPALVTTTQVLFPGHPCSPLSQCVGDGLGLGLHKGDSEGFKPASKLISVTEEKCPHVYLKHYNKNIEEDKSYVLNNYPGITSDELRSYIKDYILHSNNFSEEEKNVISQP